MPHALHGEVVPFLDRALSGISTPGQSYGGWEGPRVEIRGQFAGHYMSALAFAAKNTGRGVGQVRLLAFVEQALLLGVTGV